MGNRVAYSIAIAMAADLFEGLNANSMFMVQMVIAACIGGLEFCSPALFVDTFNTFEVYTAHRLYGATMIVNAIIVWTMRETSDPKLKREVVQAFLFQFGLHIIVLLRPQVWGFLTSFNKVNLLCSFALAATYGYLLMGEPRRLASGFTTARKLQSAENQIASLKSEIKSKDSTINDQKSQIERLEAQLKDAKRKQ